MFDYHVHTKFSFDCSAEPLDQLLAAKKIGISELCFTDHVDFDTPQAMNACVAADISGLRRHVDSLKRHDTKVRIKIGAEVALSDDKCASLAWKHISPYEPDFIIGSVHAVNGVDTYYPEYFFDKSQRKAYIDYLSTVVSCIRTCDYFSVLGHYDFVTKYAPYENRELCYPLAREVFDEIFHMLIDSGRGLEINTSAWRKDPCWGMDVLKRYVELGGEYVTLGSDAHRPEAVGRRLCEALELSMAAGIRYIATFNKLVPSFHPVEKLKPKS